jgi:hypothetical protein
MKILNAPNRDFSVFNKSYLFTTHSRLQSKFQRFIFMSFFIGESLAKFQDLFVKFSFYFRVEKMVEITLDNR